MFLFVPVEQALHAALETAPELVELALGKNIVLVTAPNVIATARLVAQLWQQDSQNRHARQIAEQGGKLYDKFAAFCRDLENIGLRIRQTQESYDDAMNKLRDGRGNLLRQTENLRTLGARTTAATNKINPYRDKSLCRSKRNPLPSSTALAHSRSSVWIATRGRPRGRTRRV